MAMHEEKTQGLVVCAILVWNGCQDTTLDTRQCARSRSRQDTRECSRCHVYRLKGRIQCKVARQIRVTRHVPLTRVMTGCLCVDEMTDVCMWRCDVVVDK